MSPIPVPKGYSFAAVAAGFKKKDKLDLGLIVSEKRAVAAGVFTTNLFKAAPVLQCIESLSVLREARAVVVNSGQANACTGDEGRVNCRLTLEMVGELLGCDMVELLPASTGVIGQHLKLDKWREAMPALKESLGQAGPVEFAKAIMTTDTFPKLVWRRIEINGKEVRLMGMAKGAGMICPNMATLLGFVITDAAVEPEWWRTALRQAVDKSFNRVTVDGDTSTNDTIVALANGASGVDVSEGCCDDLAEALTDLCQALAYMIVEDAEGGTKVMRISVVGASDRLQAELAARAVGHSPLVKTAMYGKDANWGRIVAALGRSGAQFDPDQVSVAIGNVTIFDTGRPVAGDMDALLAPLMRKQDVDVRISLGQGPGEYVLLASDLTHEYISINADYRS
ncbi:Arginine biosynthesis bifunctional protein ArgJ [Desulfovibrio sp. X2]|uniref:bifunctional glutamate N-acetyltransferase/amino-acid acetyltransferase ArgJ n=1 Tax=Desulfovibrio sp. X2 TaxID=941449 RepID=UPI000358E5B1|nr:bifunctional glutamate N-acetyltransferase/amino-acid acetyltransferase ArgJ [Desulfovibrio sp. X2]EPR43526.1 Arginine biosynthesis bifunctional protein ArgJ [Desulfovibrio sp. X2]